MKLNGVTIISSVWYIRQEKYAIILILEDPTPIIEVIESVKEKSTSMKLALKIKSSAGTSHLSERDISIEYCLRQNYCTII